MRMTRDVIARQRVDAVTGLVSVSALPALHDQLSPHVVDEVDAADTMFDASRPTMTDLSKSQLQLLSWPRIYR